MSNPAETIKIVELRRDGDTAELRQLFEHHEFFSMRVVTTAILTGIGLDDAETAARFDQQKLDWLNAHYLRAEEPKALAPQVAGVLEGMGIDVAGGPDLSQQRPEDAVADGVVRVGAE